MSERMRIAALAAIGWFGFLLTGCATSTSDAAKLTCPKVMTTPETQTIAFFGPGGHAAKDVIVGGRIRNIDAHCDALKVGVDVQTEISFEAQRASLDQPDVTLPYFVALVDPTEHLLSEQGFTVRIRFEAGEPYRRMPVEKITVHLPVKDKSQAGSYTVVVGFQLTPDQMAFNRAAQAQ